MFSPFSPVSAANYDTKKKINPGNNLGYIIPRHIGLKTLQLLCEMFFYDDVLAGFRYNFSQFLQQNHSLRMLPIHPAMQTY